MRQPIRWIVPEKQLSPTIRALTIAELTAVLPELTSGLVGGWVQKIHQPSPDSLTLDVRKPGTSLTLLISAHPHTGRIHLIRRRGPNPPTPPAFCQFLRSHIQGAQVTAIEQIPGDRIVTIRFQSTRKSYGLVVALTGRHSNLVVVNDQGIILHSLHSTLAKVGQPYNPPKPVTSKTFSYQKHREPDLLNPDSRAETDTPEPFPKSRALEKHYDQLETNQAQALLRQAQTGGLTKTIKKLKRKILAYEQDLEAASQYKEYQRYGELLKHHLPHIQKGQTSITVVDYFDEALPKLTLPLDPTKDPRGNMESYFRKHRKYAGAERQLSPRLENLRAELTNCLTQLEAIQTGQLMPEKSEDLSHSSPRSPQGRSKTSPALSAMAYRRFRSVDGLQIFVGRNAEENDRLTFREGQSYDLWFHARGTPGSHVLLKVEKNTPPPHEAIRDAATLALLYSDKKKSGKGEVIYTQKKHVKKAKGQKPGAVIVSQEKSIWAELEPDRLHRLKTSGIQG